MRYEELKIKVRKEDLEIVEAILIDNGFTSMMIDDPDDIIDILEHPDVYKYDYLNSELTELPPKQPAITLYFADDEEGKEQLKKAIDLIRTLKADFSCEMTGEDSEWLYKWQEFFKPTKVGDRIVVKPGWEDYEPVEDELVIEMEPGMAFGSGLHETTSMCIKALEQILCKADPADPETSEASEVSGRKLKVLDVGCGTGILAIAAALLGADECLGIDIDPEAVRVAKENIAKNHLEGKISAQYGDLTEGVDYEADIVVANLMADLVIRLSPAAFGHLGKGGWYVSSGILDVKEEVVCKAIKESGFEIFRVLHDEEWCAVIAHRQ